MALKLSDWLCSLNGGCVTVWDVFFFLISWWEELHPVTLNRWIMLSNFLRTWCISTQRLGSWSVQRPTEVKNKYIIIHLFFSNAKLTCAPLDCSHHDWLDSMCCLVLYYDLFFSVLRSIVCTCAGKEMQIGKCWLTLVQRLLQLLLWSCQLQEMCRDWISECLNWSHWDGSQQHHGM